MSDIEVYCELVGVGGEYDPDAEARFKEFAVADDAVELFIPRSMWVDMGSPAGVYIRAGTDRSGERDGPLREWPKPVVQ